VVVAAISLVVGGVLIYATPVLLLLEVIGYRIVAENRQRSSRWFGMRARLIKQSYH
jgi:predicted DCC family thiol-disulfide oxidoreductase YuxK